MKFLMPPILPFLTLSLSLSGCSLPEPHSVDMHGFYNQRTSLTAWGLWTVTATGPIGAGYIHWQRNYEDQEIAQPPARAWHSKP